MILIHPFWEGYYLFRTRNFTQHFPKTVLTRLIILFYILILADLETFNLMKYIANSKELPRNVAV